MTSEVIETRRATVDHAFTAQPITARRLTLNDGVSTSTNDLAALTALVDRYIAS